MRGAGMFWGESVAPPPALAALGHPPPQSGRGISRAPCSLSRFAGEGWGGGATDPHNKAQPNTARSRHPGTPA
jgi:hypothetical protein